MRCLGRSMNRPKPAGRNAHLLACLILAAATCLAGRAAGEDRPSDKTAVDFSRDVLPIFSDNCFKCHGPDEKSRKGKLRLDTKEGSFRVRDGQSVIVPGKGARSELFRRITTTNQDDLMPTPESNRK